MNVRLLVSLGVWVLIGGAALYSLRWDNPNITLALGLFFLVWAVFMVNSSL